MNKYITKFNETGICVVDTKKLIRDWKVEWSVSQYHEDYTLIAAKIKVKISKDQAEQLIKSIPLFGKKSSLFRNGTSWITELHKLSEIERLSAMSNSIYWELKALESAKTL